MHNAIYGKGFNKTAEYMNFIMDMGAPLTNQDALTKDDGLNDWLKAYNKSLSMSSYRELSGNERSKVMQNIFHLQNILSERFLPPSGVKFETDNGSLKWCDKRWQKSYVERFVFVTDPVEDKTIHTTAIQKFNDYMSKYSDHTYIAFNDLTKDGRLVGVMEFKQPKMLGDLVKYLKLLGATHNFTIYHLGNGNEGEMEAVNAEEERKWFDTKDWQTIPIMQKYIIEEGGCKPVHQDNSQKNDLEIFKRVVKRQRMRTPVEEGKNYSVRSSDYETKGIMKREIVTVKDLIERPDGTLWATVRDCEGVEAQVARKHLRLAVGKDYIFGPIHDYTNKTHLRTHAAVQYQMGYPCAFKTSAFVEPWKFYSKYVESLNEIEEEGERRIRTIKGKEDFLIKDCMEIKRMQALEELTRIARKRTA